MSGIVLGLGLALVASLALNGSYVIQHVGSASAPPVDARRPLFTVWSLLRSRWWALGAALGMAGWAVHVAALSHAPLSLVQAFVAGGLALMAPVAARALGSPLTGAERFGVAIVVVSLVLLCVGLGNPGVHGAVDVPAMTGFLIVAGLAAGLLARARSSWRAHALGLAGGVLYGAADVAIKALTGEAHSGGAAAVVTSPWLPAAAVATVGAFFSFQRGLQSGRAVPVISLMTAGTTAVSVLGGFVVFGDPLGHSPLLVAVHLIAFALVAVAAAALAPVATAAERASEAGPAEPPSSAGRLEPRGSATSGARRAGRRERAGRA